jgi:hypothetical protein
MSSSRISTVVHGLLMGVVLTGFAISCAADESPASVPSANSGLYVKVQLDHPVKLSKLKPGDIIQGKLARDVYSADRELYPAQSAVRLTVDHMEKRHRPSDDHWPWVVKVFTPRHEKYPVFKTAAVSGPNGESALQVAVLSVSRRREVHAQAKRKQSGKHANEAGSVEVGKSGGLYGSKNLAAPIMVLEASAVDGKSPFEETNPQPSTGIDLPALEELPAGTGFKILLLGDVSASKNRPGDKIQARLLEPVFLKSRIALPAGSVFEGKVIKQTPPRWGSRAGSLSLTFTGVTLPGGNFIPIAASLAGAELDRGSHTKIDAEGQLRGERPGKAWMAINLGVTAGLAKEVDDGTQLIVEALISTATDASTAGTARIVSSCISGIYMVTRHGRDVVLPRFTEMDIALDRPLSLTKNAQSALPVAMVHGN